MYSGRSYLIDVRVNGNWLMTGRVTEQAILNKMQADNKTFKQAQYGLLLSQFSNRRKKGGLYARVYQRDSIRECVNNGSSKFEEITYELTVSEIMNMMARNAAREFIR